MAVFEPFLDALADLAGFERLWLLYHLDRAAAFKPRVVPYRDTVERGLFATRSPSRPNPIGLSAVRLISVERDGLLVEGLDVLDETPLLDIKPYVPEFDSHPSSKAGWFESALKTERADGRFEREPKER